MAEWNQVDMRNRQRAEWAVLGVFFILIVIMWGLYLVL
jgi:hypothetical protein